VRAPAVGEALLRDGRVTLAGGALVYEAMLDAGGREVRLRARRATQPGKSLGERLSSLRRLHVELLESGRESVLAEGMLDPQGGGTTPVPLPIVTDAPSMWRRLSTAAAFERVMAAELVAGSVAAPPRKGG
jgi:hypothetical protein